MTKPADEFLFARRKAGLRIKREMTGEISGSEEDIANLICDAFGLATLGRKLLFDLRNLFANLRDHGARVAPVEADARRPFPAA